MMIWHLLSVDDSLLLKCTQPRVNALMQGKIDEFRLDMLVDSAHRLGLDVSIEVAG